MIERPIPQREGLNNAAVRVIWAWVCAYTRGLPADTRDSRRAEMASDIVEHRREAAGEGRNFAAELLRRWLLGLSADLSWRVQNAPILVRCARLAVAGGAGAVNGFQWTVNRGLPGVTLCLVGFYVALAAFLLATLGIDGSSPASERASIALFLGVSAGLIVGGLRLVGRHRAWGMALLLAGAVPLALAMSASVVVPVASAAAVLTGIARLVKAPARRGRII